MKKIAILLAVLTLLLCACTKVPSEPATRPTTPEASDAPSAEPTDDSTPAPSKDAGENGLFEKAKTCEGKSVDELYALIGEPNSSDYAPSCLGSGEDGNLYYDGFTVYTYREGDKETIEHVLADK